MPARAIGSSSATATQPLPPIYSWRWQHQRRFRQCQLVGPQQCKCHGASSVRKMELSAARVNAADELDIFRSSPVLSADMEEVTLSYDE